MGEEQNINYETNIWSNDFSNVMFWRLWRLLLSGLWHYKKIKNIGSVFVVLKIAIFLFCDLFIQANCFLFTDGVLAEHDMYYNRIKRKHNRNRKVMHIFNWKSVKMFVG